MSINIISMPCKNFKYYGVPREETNSVEIHSIGAGQDEAEVIRNNMNVSAPSGIVTSIVDAKKAGKVLELLPHNNITWADGGYGNHHSITIELAESDTMKYIQNSANYTISDMDRFIADIRRSYVTAVEYVAHLCNKYGWNPKEKMSNGLHRVYSHQEANKLGLATAHVDPTHIWSKVGYTMEGFRNDAYKLLQKDTHTTYSDFKQLTSDADRVKLLEKIATPIVLSYGLFPSDMIARGILESGYCCGTELSKSNNICGIKASLLNDQWTGSVWNGENVVIRTPEVYNGVTTYINDYFRVYPCIEDSIRDLCAFFTTLPKYVNAGILECKTGFEQAQTIARCGYATDPFYADKIQRVINTWQLSKNDDLRADKTPEPEKKWYRVGTGWKDGKCIGQIGAYMVKENAIKECPAGYNVFDNGGAMVYANTKSKEEEIVDKAVQFMINVANDDSIGYYNNGYNPSEGYCCISLVIYAYTNAGVPVYPCNVWDAPAVFLGAGMVDATGSVDINTGAGLKIGDIIWRERHVEMITHNGMRTGARGDYDGRKGDSSGEEISEVPYSNDGWTRVFRYPVPDKKNYRVQVGAFSVKNNALTRKNVVKSKTGFDCFVEKESDGMYHVYCGSFTIAQNATERMHTINKVLDLHAFIVEV